MWHRDTRNLAGLRIVGLPSARLCPKGWSAAGMVWMSDGFEPFEATEAAARESVALTLLMHDGLLSDPLKASFGELRVIQTRSHESPDTFFSKLRLFQRGTRAPVGEVELVVSKAGVPWPALRGFRKGAAHPGEVVAEFDLDVTFGRVRYFRDRFGRMARAYAVRGEKGEMLSIFESFVPDLELLELLEAQREAG